MIKKLNREVIPFTEQEIYSMDALTLAYIGDACWSFFVRKKLIDTGIHHVHILNSFASEMVSARWQCRILYMLEECLTERENMELVYRDIIEVTNGKAEMVSEKIAVIRI